MRDYTRLHITTTIYPRFPVQPQCYSHSRTQTHTSPQRQGRKAVKRNAEIMQKFTWNDYSNLCMWRGHTPTSLLLLLLVAGQINVLLVSVSLSLPWPPYKWCKVWPRLAKPIPKNCNKLYNLCNPLYALSAWIRKLNIHTAYIVHTVWP